VGLSFQDSKLTGEQLLTTAPVVLGICRQRIGHDAIWALHQLSMTGIC